MKKMILMMLVCIGMQSITLPSDWKPDQNKPIIGYKNYSTAINLDSQRLKNDTGDFLYLNGAGNPAFIGDGNLWYQEGRIFVMGGDEKGARESYSPERYEELKKGLQELSAQVKKQS